MLALLPISIEDMLHLMPHQCLVATMLPGSHSHRQSALLVAVHALPM